MPLRSDLFSLIGDHFSHGYLLQEIKQEVTKVFPFEKMAEKYYGVLIQFNPIALIKAKTPYSFGHSECIINKAIIRQAFK